MNIQTIIFELNLQKGKWLTKLEIPMDIQTITFELNLQKGKWLVVSVYKPAQGTTYFLNRLSQIIVFYSITYEK